MIWSQLSKRETNIIKGVAILAIAIHNFMHLFPLPKENEFDFNAERFQHFLAILLKQPENIGQILFAFFGHFGVQAFIFLSAYGMTKKYQRQPMLYLPFLAERLSKIYPMFILAIAFWILIVGWRDYGLLGPIKVIYWNIDAIIFKLTFISNFLPNQAFRPVGPWWFLPFIMQFYLVFPIIFAGYNKYHAPFLFFLSVVTISTTILCQGNVLHINLYKNLIGHMPELCLGIYLAAKDNNPVTIPNWSFAISTIVFVLGCYFQVFWFFNHLAFLMLILAIVIVCKSKLKWKAGSANLFYSLGVISMPLFLVNGFLREPFVIWAINTNNWLFSILMCCVFVVIAIFVAQKLADLEKGILHFLKKTANET